MKVLKRCTRKYAASEKHVLPINQFVRKIKAIPAAYKALFTLLLVMAARLMMVVVLIIRQCCDIL